MLNEIDEEVWCSYWS